jgi:thiamine-phosphate pyrophosphorylase
MSPSSNLRTRPILCYVTDRRSLPVSQSSSQTFLPPPLPAHQPLLRNVEAAVRAGVDWIQLREKDLSTRASAALTRAALLGLQESFGGRPCPARILVNDRLDVAIAEQAAGVHLGENSLPVEETKRLLQHSYAAYLPAKDFLVGVSCHSVKAAISAAKGGADYVFFGPVFATPSKAAYGAAQGLDSLADVCHSVAIPVLAIGGITSENAASCLAAGAAGIAAIRLFQGAPDIKAVVQALRASFRS